MVGIDISSAIRKESIRIILGHAVGNYWSVSAASDISMSTLIRNMEKEETDHREEFEDISSEAGPLYSGSAAIRFWPDNVYKGIFLSTGIRHYHKKGLECMIGAGYQMKLINGLSFFISLEKNMTGSADTRRQEGTISVGLCWIFNN